MSDGLDDGASGVIIEYHRRSVEGTVASAFTRRRKLARDSRGCHRFSAEDAFVIASNPPRNCAGLRAVSGHGQSWSFRRGVMSFDLQQAHSFKRMV